MKTFLHLCGDYSPVAIVAAIALSLGALAVAVQEADWRDWGTAWEERIIIACAGCPEPPDCTPDRLPECES